jgi:hypothetical protein
MLAAIGRYLPKQEAPRVSRSRELQSYALLYELMEVAGLVFADDAAAHNGTPKDVYMLRNKSTFGENACAGMTIAGNKASGAVLGQLIQEGFRNRTTPAPD